MERKTKGLKLVNKSISRDQARDRAARKFALDESVARKVAATALLRWYEQAYQEVHHHLAPEMQVNDNLKIVSAIPGWQQKKGTRDGYVMLCNLFDSTPKPMIVMLDHEGKVTRRQLYQQVRSWLELENRVSLRMCPFRPWHRYCKSVFPIPEETSIRANDTKCTNLLGTTLLYYNYVHLRDIPTVYHAHRDIHAERARCALLEEVD